MIAMGSIGVDENASYIKKHCRKNKIDTKFLKPTQKAPTSHTVCMFEKQNERTFLYHAGANNLLDINHFQIQKLKSDPKILYVGYITLLGNLDKFSGKNTRLSRVLSQAKKTCHLNGVKNIFMCEKIKACDKNKSVWKKQKRVIYEGKYFWFALPQSYSTPEFIFSNVKI